jgi:hypothetical protein
MKTFQSIVVLAAVAAGAAAAGPFRAAGFYRMALLPDSYDKEYESPVHGFGGEFGWEFWGPLSAEVSASYAVVGYGDEYGALIPEVHVPDERLQIPVTATLSAGLDVGPAHLFAGGGGGFLHERYRFVARYLDPLGENYAVATAGGGCRVRLPRDFYVEVKDRYLFVYGEQLDYWYQTGTYYYYEGHGNVNELTVGAGVYF